MRRNRLLGSVWFVILWSIIMTCAVLGGEIFNLAADWSDESNPNGQWTYRGAYGVILNHQNDWDPDLNIFIDTQPAWANNFWKEGRNNYGHIAVWMKSVGTYGEDASHWSYNVDLPPGRVGIHGPEPEEGYNPASVTWTSPRAGIVKISGGTWNARKTHTGQHMNWAITLNSTRLSGGQLRTYDSYNSKEPFLYENGDGGSDALIFEVSKNDVIALEIIKPLGQSPNNFVGVDLIIELSGIDVPIDIKPGGCPNIMNVMDRGVLPVAVLGTEDFDVFTVDPVSIRLEGVVPIRSNYEDVATPSLDGFETCECTTVGPDGYLDLTLKFEVQEIITALGEVNDGEELELNLTGVLNDGTLIQGKDCIVIISKGASE